MDKHCTQGISLFVSSVGQRPQVAQWLAFLIIPMRPIAGTGLKSKRKMVKCSQSDSSCRDDLGIWNDTV